MTPITIINIIPRYKKNMDNFYLIKKYFLYQKSYEIFYLDTKKDEIFYKDLYIISDAYYSLGFWDNSSLSNEDTSCPMHSIIFSLTIF